MKLKLFYPTTPWYVTQKFGETAYLEYYKKNGITFTGHNGMDVIAEHGEPVRASHDGTAYYQIDQSAGHGVVIITDKEYDYGEGQSYYKTIYWHLCNPDIDPQFKSPLYNKNPNIGTPVKIGQIIGYADSTGISNGSHLHWGLKPVLKGENPNAWGNAEQNNGYQGAIDPSPYLVGMYAGDYISRVSFDEFNVNLQFGSRHPDVKRLQNVLKRLGFFTYPDCTGYYGTETAKAVLRFQFATGIVKFEIESWFGFYFGKKTREALNKLR